MGWDIIPNSKMVDLNGLAEKERARQTIGVNLIASENVPSESVLRLAGSAFMNKYAEGYPGNRYYAGCDYVDLMERMCQREFQSAFDTNYDVNVQPHSGSSANLAALYAIKLYMKLERPLKVLSLSIKDGGHLTHGSKPSITGSPYSGLFVAENYGLTDDGFINYDDMLKKAESFHPDVIICGGSAYSREWDWVRIHEIAKSADAFMLADIAHYAGLIAAGLYKSPFGTAEIVTTTTHKTLRGARGGLIFSTVKIPELCECVNKAVFPGTQGGALMNMVAAKAQTALEAQTRDFHEYAYNTMKHANIMANMFKKGGFHVVTGGTDSHMFLIDLPKSGIAYSGAIAERKLAENNIFVNKNMVPGDARKPSATSGIRIGTQFMTTLGRDSGWFIDRATEIMQILRKEQGQKHEP